MSILLKYVYKLNRIIFASFLCIEHEHGIKCVMPSIWDVCLQAFSLLTLLNLFFNPIFTFFEWYVQNELYYFYLLNLFSFLI